MGATVSLSEQAGFLQVRCDLAGPKPDPRLPLKGRRVWHIPKTLTTPQCRPCPAETLPPCLRDEWIPMSRGIDHDGHGLPDRDVGGARIGNRLERRSPHDSPNLGILDTSSTQPRDRGEAQFYCRLAVLVTSGVICRLCRLRGHHEVCSRNVIAGQAPRKPQQYLGAKACCQLPQLSQVELNP